jgi:transcription-repair coupling factor (superfamily II helicase)
VSDLRLRGKRTRERRAGDRAVAARADRPTPPSPADGASRRRPPDLAALVRLLDGAEPFARLHERLGRPDAPIPPAGRHAALAGIPHGAKTYLAAALALDPPGERICWIARDAEIGDRVAEELVAWLGDPGAVVVLEPRTALAYERSELVRDESSARVAALSRWRAGGAEAAGAAGAAGGPRVLVASVQALLQRTIEPGTLPDAPRRIAVGSRIRPDALVRELIGLGYDPVAEVAGRGELARRGGIVDVFPAGSALPVRIEWFGDEIESLRAFDPTDQRSVGPAGEVALLPASEFLRPTGGGDAIATRLGRLADRLPERLAADLARLAEGDDGRALAVGDGAEVWAPILAPATGLDHVGSDTVLIVDEPAEVADAAEFLWRQADERRAELVASGELPDRWPAAFPDRRTWKSALVRARTLELTWESELPAALTGRPAEDDPFGWRAPELPPGRTEAVARAVAGWAGEGRRVVVTSDQAPRLAEILAEAGHPAAVVGAVREAPPAGAVVLVERSLNAGFAGGPDGLVVLTDRELFGTVRVRRPKALRRVVPRDILDRLNPGDLVVHVDHGVARYERMLRRGEPGEERDYLELAFAGDGRIFVPVEQIARITRYAGGERPALSRLGGGEWARTKARVRKAVADLADELLALYAARETAEGFAFAPDTPWQAELEASFPYEETDDQLRATAEVKMDMEARRPMDRLVVGDVGYGKTEVALRAVFKAIQDERQVAILVPTTVLAAQHYETFRRRFAPFPIVVRHLSRSVPPREQESALLGLRDGSVDVVVGTHRLLSKDVAFHDLGLVVVDEEQRFGVAAKERLKRLRTSVDVLTLSATPIPRTLNLALAGIRDMSVIETPPEDRLPIQTRVAEATAGLVRDAILRELDRGGQVFYVHNRVETIEAQAEQLRALLPGIRIVVGHGQMPEGLLESVMTRFSSGDADVLVCTTIIESGLDIPNANTIVIDRADALGLAQLYQLRGRVGRSSRRAYAYLLYRRRERLSDDARKRLQAIFNASELGAGFQIALADLEIRGAGNILGAEQHGHMAAVGFDLYTRMLAEAVEHARARRESRPAVVERPGATVDLPVDAHLPDEYVPDEAQKLEVYRRLAKVASAGGLAALRQEIADRFGPMPAPVVRLTEVVELRLAAEAAGIASLSREEGELVVRFGTLDRATATRVLAGISPSLRVFSNQARIRLPRDPERAWALAEAVVARAGAAVGG